MKPDWSHLPQDLRDLFAAALAAADPRRAVEQRLRVEQGTLVAGDAAVPLPEDGRVWLIAAGKASPAMARGALPILGARLAKGLLAYPAGTDPGPRWPDCIRIIAGGHPLPDQGSLTAGIEALSMLGEVGPRDVVLLLLSGGGSAVLEVPCDGVSLADLRALTEALLHAGAGIRELNAVRRPLSKIKGGGIARRARPASSITLILSDVVGNSLEDIASGPTVPSFTGPKEALRVIERFGLSDTHARLTAFLRSCAASAESTAESTAESMSESAGGSAEADPGDRSASPRDGSRVAHVIVGSNRMALEAVQFEARKLGFQTRILTETLQGEARQVGNEIGGRARRVRLESTPFAPPACLILGGETTVTVRGPGRGGRNQELALGAASAIDGCARTAVFSFATDGVDGASKGAGAVATGDTITRSRALGLSARTALDQNDSEAFFEALADLWITGPTGTNVNDVTIALIYP